MSTTRVNTPASNLRMGLGHCDITPPVGIYHRFWGAARHDVASGVHRPLEATAIALGSLFDESSSDVMVAIDHCLFRPDDMDFVKFSVAERAGCDPERLWFLFSHTHSAGHICRSRADRPGGDLIAGYIDTVIDRVAGAVETAIGSWQPVTWLYGSAICDMGRHRDYQDTERDLFVCGFNPDRPLDLRVRVVKAVDFVGNYVATLVHYPCHPTTLAWDNSLISPDYVGALRKTVSDHTGVPCVFLLGPCGDIGPRESYVGDPEVADRNGRQVGHAAISALEAATPAPADFVYDGPVISGATLGSWSHRDWDGDRLDDLAMYRHHGWTVPLAYRDDLPSLEQVDRQLQQADADEASVSTPDSSERGSEARALAERARRLRERIAPLPPDPEYPFRVDAWQLGDAIWVVVEGEPYFWLEQELLKHCGDRPLFVLPLANGARSSYLLPRDQAVRPLYQADVAILAPGCLERIAEEIIGQLEAWSGK